MQSLRFGIVVSLLSCVSVESAVAERPNVIVFIADDVSWNDFGCYGSPSARTPHIDKLAKTGIRFTNAYLTASSCSPSRCSIISGRYPHNNGAASELHRPMAWHIPKFPGLLRQAGYYTALSGKNHMPQDKPPGNKPAPPEPWDHVDGGRTKENSGGHANWVRLTRQRPKNKPFFFWFASNDAHRGWDADKQWAERDYGTKHDNKHDDVPPFLVSNTDTKSDLASYRNEVTRFDHFVGRVVNELKVQKVLDNTLIFVLADNGRPFPRAKTRLHDSGMKTALVAHWPKGISSAGACRSVVSTIDLAPTILQAADVKIPETVQGLPLQPLLANRTARIRRYAFSEHNWHDYEAYGRSVRDGQFLYLINKRPKRAWQGPADSVRSLSHRSLVFARDNNSLTPAQADVFLAPRPEEELYDVKNDPHQLTNLANDSKYAGKRKFLSGILEQWQQETGDSVPENLSADTFDRETGNRLGRKLHPKSKGDHSGFDRDSETVNAKGPF